MRKFISFVTINGPMVELEPDRVLAAFGDFRAELRVCQRVVFPETSWIGFADITLSGVLHWHLVIIHPGWTRNELCKELRRHFPAKRAVMVSRWEKERTLFDNLERVVDYSLVTDRHAKVIFDQPIKGPETAGLIAKRLVVLQYMAGRGAQGLRLSLNMRSPRKWKAGVLYNHDSGELILIPEMEEMILRSRRKKRLDRGWNWLERRQMWLSRRATDPDSGRTSAPS